MDRSVIVYARNDWTYLGSVSPFVRCFLGYRNGVMEQAGFRQFLGRFCYRQHVVKSNWR